MQEDNIKPAVMTALSYMEAKVSTTLQIEAQRSIGMSVYGRSSGVVVKDIAPEEAEYLTGCYCAAWRDGVICGVS
ncbi:MAG: hypothetical protein ACOYNV_20355 [Propionivibrio sp.]